MMVMKKYCSHVSLLSFVEKKKKSAHQTMNILRVHNMRIRAKIQFLFNMTTPTRVQVFNMINWTTRMFAKLWCLALLICATQILQPAHFSDASRDSRGPENSLKHWKSFARLCEIYFWFDFIFHCCWGWDVCALVLLFLPLFGFIMTSPWDIFHMS